MNHYLNAMRKYATLSGRASRSEYWLYTLFLFFILMAAAIVDTALGFADEGALVFAGLINLGHLIPTFAVSVRRLHDLNKSGWWLLIAFTGIGAIVLMVWFCLKSTSGLNRFGDEPNNGPHSSVDGQGHPNQAQPLEAPSQAATAPDALDQLNKLKALHESGAVDDAEFAQMKAALINKANS